MTADKLAKPPKRERYAENMKAPEAPTPTVLGFGIEDGQHVYRLGWTVGEGARALVVFAVEGRDEEKGLALYVARQKYKAAYWLLTPSCLDGAPWGLA